MVIDSDGHVVSLLLTTETLASAVLILTWLVVMRSTRYSKWQLALISFPGTAMHEALHGMVGLVLFAKPKSFSVFPKREGNTWVLGSVRFTNLNVWNAAPVAFAPLLMLGIGLLLYVNWMLPTFHAANYLIWVASGYVTACSFFFLCSINHRHQGWGHFWIDVWLFRP